MLGFRVNVMGGLLKQLLALPGLGPLRRLRASVRKRLRILSNPFVKHFAPGHYHSPLPGQASISTARDEMFGIILTSEGSDAPSYAPTLPGIDLNADAQLELMRAFGEYHAEMPFPGPAKERLRYSSDNEYFVCGADGTALYSLLRHFRPGRVIEVGCGFSSALMLDTNDLFLGGEVRFTFIDPDPRRLETLLRPEDRAKETVIGSSVQEVDPSLFERLAANDFLVIDSSHVAKFRSDVCHILFEVMPRLRGGVHVHFHDILWPFEYPREWLAMGRAWNESYILRSFLQYNEEFSITYFNSFLGLFYRDELARYTPHSLTDTGGSLWIRRDA